MKDNGRIRHEYYKGLRVIKVSDSRDLVAWDCAELGFRGEGEEMLSEQDYMNLYILLHFYEKSQNKIEQLRELERGARFYNQRYGFEFRPVKYLNKEEYIPFVNEMFNCILSMDTPEKLKEEFIDKTEYKTRPEEEKLYIAQNIIEGMKTLKPEIEKFLHIINEGGRYVLIRQDS